MRILISQRVDVVLARGERRDALDQAWGRTLTDMLGQQVQILPMPNRPQDVGAALARWEPSLVVLSGGNDIGEALERDETESVLLAHAAAEGLPVLAVCRGMQMVQHFLGGGLVSVTGHIAQEHSVRVAPGRSEPAELVVNSFHAWGISEKQLARGLDTLYFHADGTVEAARHVQWPWLCVMWHPERAGKGMAIANEWAGCWLRKVCL